MQDMPVPGLITIKPLLIDAIEQRCQIGEEIYQTPLMTGNGRDFLDDALDEALDLSQYLIGLREEWKAHKRLLASAAVIIERIPDGTLVSFHEKSMLLAEIRRYIPTQTG